MHYETLFETLKARRIRELETAEFENGLIVTAGPGHTPESTAFSRLHCVRTSTEWYADAKLCGICPKERGEEILRAAAACQSRRTGEEEEGNFLWYAEETRVFDTNGGFFAMMPLMRLLVLCPETVPDKERGLIEGMVRRSLVWFTRCCGSTPKMYYTNPIISAAACLYTGAVIAGDETAISHAEAFLKPYFAYTDARGWGWGESVSPAYLMEILPPLRLLAVVAGKRGDAALAEKCTGYIEKLLSWVRVHGELEFVPAIRNYNTEGLPENKSAAKLFAGVTDDLGAMRLTLVNAVLFRAYIENYDENHRLALAEQAAGFRRERVFDDQYAVTWCGERIHFGTLTRFPGMPGCNQNPGWGIGWQSMPVCFAVRGEGLGYLRWEVTCGERRRCFPKEEILKPNGANASLFNEEWLPEMYTLSVQDGNIALVLRRMNHLHNTASEIADELAVPGFSGTVRECSSEGLAWTVLCYPDGACVCAAALDGMTLHANEAGDPVRDASPCRQEVECGENTAHMSGRDVRFTTVRQLHYRGENIRLDARSTETAWAIVCLDETPADLPAFLAGVHAGSEAFDTTDVPRDPDTFIRRFTLSCGERRVVLEHDPYEACFGI